MTRKNQTRQQIRAKQRAKARGKGARRLSPAAFVVAGAIAVAAVIAIVATGGDAEDQRPLSTARVVVTGATLPAFTGGSDPAVGAPAPTLQGEDFARDRISIGDDGRPKAIVFLAHWCPHCQREVPVIQAWLDAQGPPQGVDLYSVATSIDPAQPNYPPQAWLEREGWSLPVLVDDANDDAARAFGLSGFPYFVFVDADGKVVARASGELTTDQLEAYLAQTSS